MTCSAARAHGCASASAPPLAGSAASISSRILSRDRANHLPSPELEFAYRQLARSGGGIRIAALAEEIGWSRKHLVDRFRSEFGLAPQIRWRA